MIHLSLNLKITHFYLSSFYLLYTLNNLQIFFSSSFELVLCLLSFFLILYLNYLKNLLVLNLIIHNIYIHLLIFFHDLFHLHYIVNLQNHLLVYDYENTFLLLYLLLDYLLLHSTMVLIYVLVSLHINLYLLYLHLSSKNILLYFHLDSQIY